MTLDRNGIEHDNGVKLMIELIKHGNTFEQPIFSRILEHLLSSGVDPHCRVGNSAFAMSSWETALHLAVVKTQLFSERKLHDHLNLIIAISKFSKTVMSHGKFRFLTYSRMKLNDLAPIWEGSFDQLLHGIKGSHYYYSEEYSDLIEKLISSLNKEADTSQVDGTYAAMPFPKLPLPRSWKVDAKVSQHTTP